MVLDTSLLNIQQYKVRIKDKVEQSREGSNVLPRCSSYWKGSLKSPPTTIANFTYFIYQGYNFMVFSDFM